MRASAGGLCALLAAIVAAGTGSADARTRTDAPAARRRPSASADRLLDAALQAQKAGDRTAAYQALVRSYRVSPDPRVLYHLGMLAQAEGRTLDAHDLLRRYLADPELEGTDDSPEQQEARRFTDGVRPPAGSLSVLGDRGTAVSVDGRLVGVLPLAKPLLLSPSEHKVSLESGSEHVEEQVTVPAGRLGELRKNDATSALLLVVLPAVVVFDALQGASETAARRLRRALEDAVFAERLSPIWREEAARIVTDEKLKTCRGEPTCLGAFTTACEADYALIVQARAVPRPAPAAPAAPDPKADPKAEPEADWSIRTEVYDARVFDPAGQTERECPRCTSERAAASLAETFTPLWSQTSARQFGTLRIDVIPAGAQLLLDGRLLGTSPVTRAVWAGPHELVIKHPGHGDERRAVNVPASGTAREEVTLAPDLAEPPPPRLTLSPLLEDERRLPRPAWRIGAGAAAMGAGALVLGFGISALAVDGRCTVGTFSTPAPAAGDTTCPATYSTLGKGVGLSVVGGLLAAGGAVLVAIPGPRRMVQVALGGTPGGVSMALGGRF